MKDSCGNEITFSYVWDEVVNVVCFIIFIPLYIVYLGPKELWLNRKLCSYYRYPYCEKNSLIPDPNKPCKLGTAKSRCLHYKEK